MTFTTPRYGWSPKNASGDGAAAPSLPPGRRELADPHGPPRVKGNPAPHRVVLPRAGDPRERMWLTDVGRDFVPGRPVAAGIAPWCAASPAEVVVPEAGAPWRLGRRGRSAGAGDVDRTASLRK
jgi:hypothetical protein